jgi:hypothetical protein
MYMAAEIVFRAYRKKLRGGDEGGDEDGDVEDIRRILHPCTNSIGDKVCESELTPETSAWVSAKA